MEKNYASLLEKQIEKLDAEDFDLEAWKSTTVALLARIYGNEDIRLEQIQKLHVDLSSSWALRDASPSYNPLQSCKKQGRELLQLTIEELKTIGLPDMNTSQDSSVLFEILQAELKGSQLKELNKILDQSGDQKKAIQKLVKSWGAATNVQILSLIVNSHKGLFAD